MDAPPLPDDPRDWPTDPFALLGVPRSVSETDLKRAYTRLIRKYKPEHAPEEFRRIREAYEAAIEMSRWYRDAPPVRDTFRDFPLDPVSPPPAPLEPPASVPHEAPVDSPKRAPHETHIDPPVYPAHRDPVEAAWGDAVAGAWADAYAALLALADAHPDRADLPLRLYWLLALRPTLDDNRTRHDWLAAALTRARLRGPAVELYRRELAADPGAALGGPYGQLLEVPGASGTNVLTIATARLAASRDASWAAVHSDLTTLARRAPNLDESAWLSYLVDLCARAMSDRSLLARGRELLADLKHLELSHSWAFDQLDERQLIFTDLRAARIPEPIRLVLAATRIGPEAERKALTDAIAWAAGDPARALRACDIEVGANYERTLLTAFERLLNARSGHRDAYPPALVRGLVRTHLSRTPVLEYYRTREPLLRFLLAERIDPEELTTACLVDPHPATRALVRHVQADDTLRLVYRTVVALG
ncbi:J domain-containing protein [Gemmata sp. G18]|uniref:J domain-containing protein n=1 Tax=Gemmata palustris TaxID=2822762 RepID=A0ABS5BW45_9BACT|nr:J domain-containing protein [Gemmata palustris]MBP3957952.1 J domain-containing protein [Gemmata palustris]